jgi:hypothetical protein
MNLPEDIVMKISTWTLQAAALIGSTCKRYDAFAKETLNKNVKEGWRRVSDADFTILRDWRRASRQKRDKVMRFFMPEDEIDTLNFQVKWDLCDDVFESCVIVVLEEIEGAPSRFRLCELHIYKYSSDETAFCKYDWNMRFRV